MNTSQYMDKQIMDLSNSQSNDDFADLINPQEDHIGDGKKEEIVPSYDFQPIRPVGAPQSIDSSNAGGTRVWTSADSKINSGIRNYDSLDSIEPGKVVLAKDHNVYDAALVSAIDRTMKKHTDSLLHALEGVSARLSQLESRTRHIENSVDDLKASAGFNHAIIEGKMTQMDFILREVQNGVQVMRDKKEIVEAQLQLAKMRVPKVEHQSETQNTVHTDSVHQAASAPMQSHHQLPPVALTQPPHPTLPPPNAPPPPLLQILPPSVQLPNQFPPNQMPPYFPPPGQTPEASNQQYQLPPQQLQPPTPAQPQQPYQPPPQPQYSQLPPPPLPQSQSQSQPPLGHHPEETPYIPSQNYPPNIRQPPSHPPPSGAPPSQQFYGTPSHMYEPPSSRPGSGFSAAYGPSSGTGEQFTYSGPPQYGSGSPMKPQQLSSPSVGHSGGSGYPQLPTARILPHALPTASGVSGGSGSSGTGNRVPIDDVVDKVTNMGFPREQVRATVRRLTENGQAVDLNVVLDKLMNGGGEGQPERGWFGR